MLSADLPISSSFASVFTDVWVVYFIFSLIEIGNSITFIRKMMTNVKPTLIQRIVSVGTLHEEDKATMFFPCF